MKNRMQLSSALVATLLAFPAVVSAQGRIPATPARISPIDAAPSASLGDFSCPNGGPPLIEQPPNQSNGLFADSDCGLCSSGQQSLADDFVLTAPTAVRQIVFWGGYFPGNEAPKPPDALDVIFHQDASGLPGDVIDSENLVPTSATLTGVELFGVNEILYVVDITPVVLPAGTFWVEIFTDSAGTTDSFFWEAGDLDSVNGRLNDSYALETPGVTWLTGNPVTDLAFALCGGIAELEPEALEVDFRSLASDGNGVFEAGEQVEVAPEWRNVDVFQQTAQGTASGFTGPAGPDYVLVSSAANYGVIDPGAIASCQDTGMCYTMEVGPPFDPRPAAHWDAAFDETLDPIGGKPRTWTLHIGDSFTDVPPTSLFYASTETVLHNAVSSGCTATQYCPGSPNTRGQMSVFLLKALMGGDFVPPACVEGDEPFVDVPFHSPFCSWIRMLVDLGVTSGCGGDHYCPGDPVNRSQMAVFLLKTLEGSAYVPPDCEGVFDDVTCPSLFADWVEDLVDRGITAGCGGGNYCPADPVTRGQMAVFLSRTFGLTLYGP